LAWVIFERGVKGEGYHIHALIKGINPCLAMALKRKLNNSFGSCKVDSYDHSRKIYPASEYIAEKYVLLNQENLEFFRINSRLRKSVESPEKTEMH
jgi:hypothetical protein